MASHLLPNCKSDIVTFKIDNTAVQKQVSGYITASRFANVHYQIKQIWVIFTHLELCLATATHSENLNQLT